ncbi:MAG: CDC27 family protein [Pedobacter sp.]|nr:CDC27 family protein [Pedobacter sp.]
MAKRKRQPPAASPADTAATSPSRRARIIALSLCALLLIAAGAAGLWWKNHQKSSSNVTASGKQFVLVDEAQCAGCHQAQFKSWQGSHHHLAMQDATPATVLADFSGVSFKDQNGSSRFLQEKGKFLVETTGGDGKTARFEVTHTFGIEPLQQYLLSLPNGRLQAFTIVWDTEKKKWFSLHGKERIAANDELHWSKPAQNWNFMCAECHTTGLKRNFDIASNSYNTQWHSLGVGCQSCHGPASGHLDWAKSHQKKNGKGSGFAVALPVSDSAAILDTCGRCHSRRAPLRDGYVPAHKLADDYLVSLLSPTLYHTDGKIKDEVFEYGSFVQSKMFMKGLNCADCHDPHSGKTRLPGNQLCSSCHNASAAAARPGINTAGLQKKNYDSIEHTRHQPGTPGAACVSCHMPGKFYMGNDFRHDHSFSIPRPDLSKALDSPNACNSCHADKSADWAAGKIKEWRGAQARPKTFGEFMKVLREGGADASGQLLQFTSDPSHPPIQRATALQSAGNYPGVNSRRSITQAMSDTDPLVRQAALDAMGNLPPAEQIALAGPLLRDPVKSVRITAAWQLSTLAPQLGNFSSDWKQAMAEYEAVQKQLVERPESLGNLAQIYRQREEPAQAWQAMEQALRLNADFEPALVMKSEMLGASGNHEGALQLLRDALQRQPKSAGLQHAYGLALVRGGKHKEALAALKRASELAPDNGNYAYVYAVALHDLGQPAQAIKVLDAGIKRNASQRSLWMTAIRYRQEAGDSAAAQALALRWLRINPGDPALQQLQH